MFWVDAELGSDVYLDGNIFFFFFGHKVPLSLCTGDRNIFNHLVWLVSIVFPRLAGSLAEIENRFWRWGLNAILEYEGHTFNNIKKKTVIL